MQLKIEGQKRDPKIGKKYIILIYKSIREGVQIPLSPQKTKPSTLLRVLLFYTGMISSSFKKIYPEILLCSCRQKHR